MHAALSIEGDAVMVVRFGAGVEPGPGEPSYSLLQVVGRSLDVGQAVGFRLGGEQRWSEGFHVLRSMFCVQSCWLADDVAKGAASGWRFLASPIQQVIYFTLIGCPNPS